MFAYIDPLKLEIFGFFYGCFNDLYGNIKTGDGYAFSFIVMVKKA